jgi:hypothetical protein
MMNLPLLLSIPLALVQVYSLFFTSCCEILEQYIEYDEVLLEDDTDEEVTSHVQDEPTIYTQFVMNTHDWVMLDRSIETIHRVIDIHEQYDVPIDIYLTDPIVQGYMENDPTLIERLATSEVVAVSIHARPPAPYAASYDWLGLGDMSDEELHETLYKYATERIDLETGEIAGEPGGIQYLTELIGYTPLITGIASGGSIGRTLSEIYTDMGSLFVVQHGTLPYRLGDMKWDQYLRPEHVAIKLYESKTADAASVIEENLLDTSVGEEDVYLNLKYHENNFYADGTTFAPVYWVDYDSNRNINIDPPWDLSLGSTDLKMPSRQDQLWELWENAVIYISENPDRFTAINAFDLAEMVKELE